MLTVTVPSLSFQLTTLSRVKLELRIDKYDTSEDEYLTAAINEASDIITHETQRTFAKQRYTETLPGSGLNTLTLTKFPLITLDSIVHYRGAFWADDLFYDSSASAIDGTTLSTTLYDIKDRDLGIIYGKRPWVGTYNFAQNITATPVGKVDSYSVNYTAGWVLPSTQSTTSTSYEVRTLPYDVEGAAVTLVRSAYFGRDRDPLVKSERTGDSQQILFDVPYGVKIITGLPPSVYRVIDKYTIHS